MAYTKHGLHIPGSPEDPIPDISKCEGYASCRQCLDEAHAWQPSPVEEDFLTYVRKPFFVKALKVTLENIHQVAEMIGDLREPPGEEPFIRVDKTKVPNIYNVRLGFYVTQMGRNIRCFAPEVFEEQFAEYTDELRDLLETNNLLDLGLTVGS